MTTTPGGSGDPSIESLDGRDRDRERDRDGLGSLRDTEAESGDEDGITDDFEIDRREARELGVELDSAGPDEPRLD